MRRQVVYTRRYISKPVRIFLWIVFAVILVQSVIQTFRVWHYIETRRQNVHTHRTAQ
jgi:hypothetical protein